MSSSKKNNFIIAIEPKTNFHFRYVTESKTSHGFLTGQRKLNKNTTERNREYPTVKLFLSQNDNLDEFQNKREFYVLCTLHSYDDMCLSPHVLLAKGNDVNYEFIFEKMNENHLNPLEKFWKLQKYIIVRVLKDVYKTALESKRIEYLKLKLPLSFEAIKGNLNLNNNDSVQASANLKVCLGFTVFEKVNESFRLYKETIYTNNIYHGDDLNIHLLCNKEGNINGGDTITILINFSSNLLLNVLITKVNNKTEETEWSKEIPIEKKCIFGNHAITFQLPPYGGPSCSGEKILVNMQVVVRDTTYRSDSQEFHYINHNLPRKINHRTRSITANNTILALSDNESPIDDDFLNDVAMNDFNNDHFNNAIHSLDNYLLSNNNNQNVSRDRILPSHMKQINSIESPPQQSNVYPWKTITNKIDQILKMTAGKQDIDIKGLEKPDDNTIFHEALAIPYTFMHLFKMANQSPHKKLVLEARNRNRENLLHYSCKYNRTKCIRPLIAMGCQLNEQDNEGRTPLHTAMQFNHIDCILEIQQLLEDHSKYPTEVKENLIKMFKVYTHRGFTVLHAAVIDNREELMEIMLQFCRKSNINIKEYQVLGTGISLEHFIYLKYNLIAVIKLIRHYIPCYFKIENNFRKFIPLYWHWLYQINQRNHIRS